MTGISPLWTPDQAGGPAQRPGSGKLLAAGGAGRTPGWYHAQTSGNKAKRARRPSAEVEPLEHRVDRKREAGQTGVAHGLGGSKPRHPVCIVRDDGPTQRIDDEDDL